MGFLFGPPQNKGQKPREPLAARLANGFRRCALLLAVATASSFTALVPSQLWAEGGEAGRLEQQLKSSKDFRLRMQAALELGRLKARPSRATLENALEDESAAVRAAAAAALKSLGDRGALAALRRRSNDDSEAVRNQVAAAIRALDSALEASYLVGLGQMETDPSVKEKNVGTHLRTVASRRLSRLPDVKLKTEDAAMAGLPEIRLDARVTQLRVRRNSSDLAVTANVDFVLSRMPGREIKGRLTGEATIHGDPKSQNRPSDLQRLRLEAVEAAADSALENVSRALQAAVE